MRRLKKNNSSCARSGSPSPALLAPVLLALLLLAAAMAGLASGCGEQTPTAAEQAAEVQNGVPAGEAATADDESDQDAADTGDGGQMVADDLPTGNGTQLVYLAGDPGDQVLVNFSLAGPWNFSGGASGSTLTITMIVKQTAPSQEEFPEATIAARSTWNPAPANVEYNFQHKVNGAWLAYGRSGPGDRLRVYSSPVRVLAFPAAVGDSWTEVYTEEEGGQTIQIRAENVIVSSNRLTVPAGTYEAFLLQTLITATEQGVTTQTWDYIWFVPGIGRAAEIISLPDEEDEVFGTAAAFYRLDSFRTP